MIEGSDDDVATRVRRSAVPAGEEDEEETGALRHRLADADLDSESGDEEAEVDEEALAVRRLRLRERAMSKIQQEEEVRRLSEMQCRVPLTFHEKK